jgi:hypothetical protein
MVSGGIAPRILNLGNGWRWVVTLQLLYRRGKSPSTYWVGGCAGPRPVAKTKTPSSLFALFLYLISLLFLHIFLLLFIVLLLKTPVSYTTLFFFNELTRTIVSSGSERTRQIASNFKHELFLCLQRTAETELHAGHVLTWRVPTTN